MGKKIDLSNLPTNKILFFLFNILLLLIAASYIGIGAWFVDSLESKPKLSIINDFYNLMGGLMMAVGIAAGLLGFYGQIISIWRNKCSMFAYISIIIILTLYGISIGIVGLVYADLTGTKITESLDSNLFTNPSSTNLVNSVQRTYKCCGLKKPDDWITSFNQAVYPSSCCTTNTVNTCSDYFQEGCLSAVSRTIRLDMAISGGISLGIALIMILGVVLSIHAMYEVIQRDKSIQYKTSDS